MYALQARFTITPEQKEKLAKQMKDLNAKVDVTDNIMYIGYMGYDILEVAVIITTIEGMPNHLLSFHDI